MKKRKLIAGSFVLLIPSFVIASIVFILVFYVSNNNNKIGINTTAQNHLNLLDESLGYDLNQVVSDIKFLSYHHREYLSTKNLKNTKMYNEYLLFSKSKKIYDQIRFLDLSGMEKMRINYNKGNPTITSKMKLQNKGSRYYFKEAASLTPGEIYISRFDLNKEKGKVEVPFKPTIRFVYPVYDLKNRKKGVIILNYLGERLFSGFNKQNTGLVGSDMLLNSDGYWLKSHLSSDEWGLSIKDRKDLKFQKKYPLEWERIKNSKSGQFTTEKGLFTYTKIHPHKKIRRQKVKNTPIVQTDNSVKSWIIVSFVPSETLNSETRELFYILFAIFIFIIILLLVNKYSISSLLEKRKASTLAYNQFLPSEFIQILDKDAIHEIELGDNVQKDFTILFSDIRSYTKISESMSSIEILNYLNKFFTKVEPAIQKYEGFIDKYIGDAVMALFPVNPETALKSAIEMNNEIATLNVELKESGVEPIKAGIGLHYGNITLGTLGSPNRMNATAIGDNVNLASRIESLTKVFGVDIIVTDSVFREISDPSKYNIREMDTVRVKGKEVPIVLYEVFDTNDSDVIEGKKKSLEIFLRGITFYKAGLFEESLELFKECLEICPKDTIPPIYIKRCNTLMRISPGDDWSGISTL